MYNSGKTHIKTLFTPMNSSCKGNELYLLFCTKCLQTSSLYSKFVLDNTHMQLLNIKIICLNFRIKTSQVTISVFICIFREREMPEAIFIFVMIFFYFQAFLWRSNGDAQSSGTSWLTRTWPIFNRPEFPRKLLQEFDSL